MKNELFLALRDAQRNLMSSRVYDLTVDKRLCNMRVNNEHGWHKCRKEGTVCFYGERDRRGGGVIPCVYLVCTECASTVRKFAKHFGLSEKPLGEFIISEVMGM